MLHQRPFRDRSQLVELLTPGGGRQGAVAHRSRHRILQPFQPLWLVLGGRGELHTLQRWEARGQPYWLHGTALFSGLYLNELLYRLLYRDEPQPELFAVYEEALAALARLSDEQRSGRADTAAQGAQLEAVLRHFELFLLEVLGYAVDMQTDAHGEPLAPDRYYRFEAATGLVPTSAPALSGQGLLDYLAGHPSMEARRAVKQLCRQALAPHLGSRPLLSRQLFAGGD